MPNEISAIKTIVGDYFAQKQGVLFVNIFGSIALGTQTPKSDVDIAIDFGRFITADELVAMASELSLLLHREVDIIDLSKSYGAVLEEAIIKGQIIWQKSPAEFARLLKKLWYDKADDGRFRQITMETRQKIWNR